MASSFSACNINVSINQSRLWRLVTYLSDLGRVEVDLGWAHGWHGNEFEIGLAAELACKPKERLLKVVVALGTDVVVLQVLFAVEGNVLGLDLAILDVHLQAM